LEKTFNNVFVIVFFVFPLRTVIIFNKNSFNIFDKPYYSVLFFSSFHSRSFAKKIHHLFGSS